MVNYYWCHADTGGHCNSKWRQHQPKDCLPWDELGKSQAKRTAPVPDKIKSKDKHDPKDKRASKKLKIAKAMSAIMNTDSDSSTA